MVIQAPTLITTGGSGADGTIYTTASINPTPGSLLVLFVDNGSVVSGDNVIPTIGGTLGLTWTRHATSGGYTNTLLRGTFFTAPVPEGGDSGNIEMAFAAVQSSCHWHVLQVMGADAVTPVAQSAFADFNVSLAPTVSFPTAPADTSLVIGALMRNNTTSTTAGTGFSRISTQTGNTAPTIGSDVFYDMPPASNAFAPQTSSGSQKTVYALEIVASDVEPPPPPTPATVTKVSSFEGVYTTGNATLPIVLPVNLTVGQTLILSTGRTTGATVFQIASIDGLGTNAYTVAGHAVRASTLIAETIVIPITSPIAAGTTITINYSGGIPNRKAYVGSVWTGLKTTINASSGTAGANGLAGTATVTTTAPSTGSEVLVIGTFSHNSTFTPGAGNTEVDTIITTAGSAERGVSQQYRMDTSVGAKSAVAAVGSNWAANVVAISPTDAVAGTPVASAGGDQIDREPWDTITISAQDSTAEGLPQFSWSQISGEPVQLVGTGATRTFVAPGTIAGTTLVFRVVVTYNGLSSSDDVSVAVLPASERIVVGGVEVPLYTRTAYEL